MADATALEIYQACLDRVAEAVMALDLDTIEAAFNLPVQIKTRAATIVVETPRDLRDGYREIGESLRMRNVTDFFWLASTAHWLSPRYIEGFHVTHILRNAEALEKPYHSRTVICETAEGWKVDEIEVGLNNAHFPISVPEIPAGPAFSASGAASPRADVRAIPADPLEIYRAFLNRYTAYNMAHDFEGWASMYLYPHTVHTDAVDKVVKTPEGGRDVFALLSSYIRDGQVDRYERVPTHAVFLNGNQICGYHESTMYRGDDIVIGPVKSRLILQRVGPDWFIRTLTNALSNKGFPFDGAVPSDTLIPLNEIKARRRNA